MFFQNYQIRNKHLINIFTFIILLLSPQVVLGAGDSISYPENNWSFSGITGTFDRASQQRGLQVCEESHGRVHTERHREQEPREDQREHGQD